MAIDMARLTKITANEPPRIVIYGPAGLGKTTLAAEFPKPVFLQTEMGTPKGVTLDSFGHLKSFDEVSEAIDTLGSEEHGFQTVVLDSLSEMERLVYAKTCANNRWKTIEEPGYGKGYKEADYVWQDLIDGMNALRRVKKMNVVYIAHSEIMRFDDPQTTSYSRYVMSLHKNGAAIISREVDAILLVKQEVTLETEKQGGKDRRAIAKGGQQRWLYAEDRPAMLAKNRYDMPDKIMFDKGEGYAALAKYLPAQPETKKAKAA